MTVRAETDAENVTGYLHPTYAESLAEFGTPVFLPASQGWILRRQIPGTPYHDAMGCYPLFACQDWSRLHHDLAKLGHDLVSLAVVTDPFGDYCEDDLRRGFQDLVIPFKEHFVVDLRQPMTAVVSANHRSKAHKALRSVHVERFPDPAQLGTEWIGLYQILIARHSIKGIPAFSAGSLTRQLLVPGIVAFQAREANKTVGMTLWYRQGHVGYYHLGAYNERGYDLHASFALFWSALQYFADEGLHWVNLGAGAGLTGNGTDGLSRFKHGWSTGTRTAFFCGRIFDRVKYEEIVHVKDAAEARFFPAYRERKF